MSDTRVQPSSETVAGSDPDGRCPAGWDEARVQAVADYYDKRTDEEAAVEVEAAYDNPLNAVLRVPRALARAVDALLSLLPDPELPADTPFDPRMAEVPAELPPDWDESRVRAIIDRFKNKTEDEAIAELEESYRAPAHVEFVLPKILVPAVELLIAECPHLDPKQGRLSRRLRRLSWQLTPRRWKLGVADRLARADPRTGQPLERTEPRVPGRLAGQVVMAPDFDETPEDIVAAFEGTSESST